MLADAHARTDNNSPNIWKVQDPSCCHIRNLDIVLNCDILKCFQQVLEEVPAAPGLDRAVILGVRLSEVCSIEKRLQRRLYLSLTRGNERVVKVGFWLV